MASRPAQKERARASRNGGAPRQPKAGSVSQRELIDQLAQQIMSVDSTISLIKIEMVKQGHTKNDLATSNGQPIMDVGGEEQATYAQWEGRQKQLKQNIEAGYPALIPLVYKRIRKLRAEQDAQTD